MPASSPVAEARALDLLITAVEADRAVVALEGTGGTRPMFPWEIASHTDFAEIDRVTRAAYSATATALDTVRDAVLNALTNAIGGTEDPRALVAQLNTFAATMPPEVRAAINESTASIAAVLDDVFTGSAAAVGREAAHQGVIAPVDVPLPLGHFDPPASTGPSWVWQRLNTAAQAVNGTRPAPAADIVDAAKGTDLAGAYDLARQAVHVAHGEGRAAAAAQLPGPQKIYASELLDHHTCKPCRRIDGHEYATLPEALDDYPAAGPYESCLGGDRCRGTLVFIWSEAPATAR